MSGSFSDVTSEDVVDPLDAALNELLVHVAEQSSDRGRRAAIVDIARMAPPIATWPPEMLQELFELSSWVGLRRRLEQEGGTSPSEGVGVG